MQIMDTSYNRPDFLNQVIEVNTQLDATETLKEILSIEKNMFRIRKTRKRSM